MPGNCLAGCIADFNCKPIKPPDFDVASPFVKITFNSSGHSITVGNESAPCCGHNIVITSFEYGTSSGFTMNVEMIDEQGGQFKEFADQIIKCGPNIAAHQHVMSAEWGWIYTFCDGKVKVVKTAKPLDAVAVSLDVVFAGEGFIKYIIKGKPVVEAFIAFREDNIFGEDGKRMCLRDAIVQLCAIPPAVDVEFLRRNASGQPEPLVWKINGKCGPKGVWAGDSMNKLSTIAKWVEPFMTINDKGVSVITDNSSHKKIVIWEDLTQDPGESRTCKSGPFGTFFVNAGKCSNVMEFSPTFNWYAGLADFAVGGNAGSAATGKIELKENGGKKSPEDEHGTNTGQDTGVTVSRSAWDVHGPKNATKETNKAQGRHYKANRMYRSGTTAFGASPIEADLKIVGDPNPQYVYINLHCNASLAVVVIDPFHINPNYGSQECGGWLSQPTCNPVLSNKSWKCLGVHHSIKDGNYETTLKLKLAVPSIEVGSDEPLGGPGSLGYTPNGTCGS